MLKVYKQDCKECLFSKNRIVSKKRATEIINGCVKKQTYFICHKATMQGKDVCCHSFYKNMGHVSQMVRIAERLNAVEMIDQPEK